MAKQNGLDQRLFYAGYDLSGTAGSIDSCSVPRGVLDVTALNKTSKERIYGHRDGMLSYTSYFDPDTILPAVEDNDTPAEKHIMWALQPSIGGRAFSMVARQVSMDGSRGDDGSFTFKVEGQAGSNGGEWGRMLTAGALTQTGAAAVTSWDSGAATSFGAQIFLQVFSFTGTSVTVTIQSSSDNGAGDAFAAITGGAFTAVTGAPAVQRLQTARNQAVERYLRVITTGTFSEATFAVMVVKNTAEVLF